MLSKHSVHDFIDPIYIHKVEAEFSEVVIGITWVSWRLKSQDTRMFVQQLIRSKKSKICIIGPLWGKTTDDRGIALTYERTCLFSHFWQDTQS